MTAESWLGGQAVPTFWCGERESPAELTNLPWSLFAVPVALAVGCNGDPFLAPTRGLTDETD
jgi:hypothetical protein